MAQRAPGSDRMSATDARTAAEGGLTSWLAFLGITDCTCTWQFKGIGVLYGVSLGRGWVRMTTEPGCYVHGTAIT